MAAYGRKAELIQGGKRQAPIAVPGHNQILISLESDVRDTPVRLCLLIFVNLGDSSRA
jgi:hypothetical protein